MGWDISRNYSIYPSTVSHRYLTSTFLSARDSVCDCHLFQKLSLHV